MKHDKHGSERNEIIHSNEKGTLRNKEASFLLFSRNSNLLLAILLI